MLIELVVIDYIFNALPANSKKFYTFKNASDTQK